MPVVEIAPPVTASPCSAVAPLSSAQVRPPSARTVRASGSTSRALHLGEIDHHRVVDDRAAGHVVATAADADVEPGGPGEAHAGGCVGCAPAADDHRRAPVDQPVVDAARVVVAVVPGPQDASGDLHP